MKKAFIIKTISPFFLLILLIPKIMVLTGCASIIPPTGGPRDTIPPVLLKSTPGDSSKNFKDKTITFTFDEYVELQDAQTNLLVSPLPKIPPFVEAKLKTVIVKIKDTLEPNTTYYYNFGKSIKDYTEGNVLPNFSYIFSTGNIIDSLEFSGKVVLAETGGVDSTLIVMLHKNPDDSAVIKDSPRYIARLDSMGNYHFRYLPSGTFYLYALKDQGNTGKYLSPSQLFAFADSPVETRPGAQPVTLYAFVEKKEEPRPGAQVSFNRGTGGRTEERRLKFSTTTSNGNEQDLLTSFSILFDTPLRNFDSSKLELSTDSSFIKDTTYSWEQDSLKKKLTLNIKWKENTFYNLILDKEFASDTSGRKLLKTDTIKFHTKKPADYGSLKISFNNFDSTKNPVLQVIQAGTLVNSFPVTKPDLLVPMIVPGDYELRMLYDQNKNGKWDTGDFFGKRIQPEKVRPLNKKITIKASWDNEYEVTL